jgi:hypothetical protein
MHNPGRRRRFHLRRRLAGSRECLGRVQTPRLRAMERLGPGDTFPETCPTDRGAHNRDSVIQRRRIDHPERNVGNLGRNDPDLVRPTRRSAGSPRSIHGARCLNARGATATYPPSC